MSGCNPGCNPDGEQLAGNEVHAHSQDCEVCGTPVLFSMRAAPFPGMPDFVRAVEGCWLGWCWSTETTGKLALIALCSQLCLTRWFEDVNETGA